MIMGLVTRDPSGPIPWPILQRRNGSVATLVASAVSFTVYVPYGVVPASGPNSGMPAMYMNVETDQP